MIITQTPLECPSSEAEQTSLDFYKEHGGAVILNNLDKYCCKCAPFTALLRLFHRAFLF